MTLNNLGGFDEIASAYGLIQVVYADLTERLAVAVFKLRQVKEPTVTFGEIWKLKFGQLLSTLKKEIKLYAPHGSAQGEITALRKMCGELKALSEWRNDRVHARVRRVGDGLALYNGRTGNRLSISKEECWEVLQKLTSAMFEMEIIMADLLRRVNVTLELQALLDEMTDKDVEGGEFEPTT